MRKLLILLLTITMPIWILPVIFIGITDSIFTECYESLTELFEEFDKK